MKNVYYLKLRSLAIISLIAFSGIACESDVVEDIRSDEDFVDQPPVTYDEDNELIPGQYIVLLKTDGNSERFPELRTLEEHEELLSRRVADRTQMIHMKATREVDMGEISASIIKSYGMDSKQIIDVIEGSTPGFVISMSARDAVVLEEDPDVDIVEQDRIQALGVSPLIRTPFVPSNEDHNIQQIPYGIDRVGGSVDFETDPEWKNRWVWIVDTGIDKDHPDLNVIQYYSKDFTKDRNYDDEHGHGTHVAGIIAAKANGYGVSGVAAGAKVVAIKVLDKKGKGKLSQLIKGLNFIKRYCLPNDVVNISLGGDKSKSLEKVIKDLDKKNIHIVMAAGNSGKHAKDTSPGNIDGDNLYTVGALDWNDNYMDYSNFGENVDFAAPGHGILSTFPGGKYAYMSGTSMASPHIAGIMVLGAGEFESQGKSRSQSGDVTIIKHKKKK